MLQFIMGRAGSGKTEYLRRMLVDLSGSGRQGLIMLVPEQYSFETEKAILQLAGPRRANQIQVLSFTRLAELFFRSEGGVAGERLSDGGRRMMMSLAAQACTDRLNVYQKAVKDGRIADIMLTAIHEMKLCRITGDMLRGTAAKITDSGLHDKLYELSILGDTYNAMVSSSYLDSRDDLTRLADALRESDFFAGCTVAVDSFEGFTAQETAVLIPLMQRAATVAVSLCTDNLATRGHGLFSLVNRTRDRLAAAARENGVKIAPELVLRDAPRFRNPHLRVVEQNLFSDEAAQPCATHDGIHLFSARDPFEESDYVAAAIRNLVMEKGYQYHDFSVVCRTPEAYAGSLETAFQKRDIPCFISHPQRVDAEPVMRFVLCAFEAVQHGMDPEDLFDMLKTGISGLTAEEIAELENYSFLWQLKGRNWKVPFTRHPRGFGQELTADDEQTLLYLNELRGRVVEPLMRFADKTADTNGRRISHAVYELLTDFRMEENLPAYCRALEDSRQPSLSEKQIRIWELLIEILEQMAAILGDTFLSREAYYRLLREVIRGEDVSEIPQVLDAVLFGMPEQVRQTTPKVVFLIGAVQGEFPLIPKNSGVFSDSERQKLIALELPLGDPLPQRVIEERYLAYSVASLASEELYVCWPRSRDGEDLQPGEIVSSLREIFPALEEEQPDPSFFFANSYEAAFSRMAELFTVPSPEGAALRGFFAENPAYDGRLLALERAADKRPEQVKNTHLARDIFGHIPYLSPTQIETFYQCKFRYFCQYGMGAQERRTAEVDAMQYGSIMHYLFEHIFSQKDFSPGEASDEELLSYIETLIDAYVQANMGGWDSISAREQYRLKRMAQAGALLIRHVWEELRQSRFTPEGFEVRLGEHGDFPPLRIRTPEGNTVTVGGTVDRIDLYESERGRFVRVIDYKTGQKNFELTDVLYGLNIQMLVYLAALTEQGRLIPAGVLYTPLAAPSVSADRADDAEKLQSERDKALRMNGVVLKDAEIITAMEEAAAGRYIPAKIAKASGQPMESKSVLEESQLRAVLSYAKSLVATMADELYRGQIEAKPVVVNRLGCTFCPYRTVCGREYGEKDIQKQTPAKADVLAAMTAEKGDEHDDNQLDQ